jgi:predicted amidophosphoribosyltransferase
LKAHHWVRLSVVAGMLRDVRTLMDLLVPSHCAGCQRDGPALCPECTALLGRPLRVRLSGQLPPVYALGRYRGPLRAALLAYKERGRRELAGPLGTALAVGARYLAAAGGDRPAAPAASAASADAGRYGVRADGVRADGVRADGVRADGVRADGVRADGGQGTAGVWLVPVPSRSSAARRRGGDHVRRIVERAASELAAGGIPAAVTPALRLDRGVRDSVGLDAVARAANLAGRIRPREADLPPPGTGVILIDDVVTTGATAAASTAALAAADLAVSVVLVLASAAPLLRTGGLRDRFVTMSCDDRAAGSMTA